MMYTTSSSMESEKESPFPTQSAPPCPRPLPPSPPVASQIPSHVEQYSTVTAATRIALNKSKTSNPATAPNPDSHSPVPWSTGLCDCCDAFNSCCLTCWCPCVTFGRIAEMVDRGSTCNVWSERSTLHVDIVRNKLFLLVLMLL
ncbi:hypothetical protein CRYUN_Cryun04dG0209000 [Craigia yunnanensis]